jgi:Cell division protein CrgA
MPKRRSKRRKRPPPPKPKPRSSPVFVGPLFFTLLGVGVIVIIGNYLELFPGPTSNWRLWYGLALVAGAFGVATQWR